MYKTLGHKQPMDDIFPHSLPSHLNLSSPFTPSLPLSLQHPRSCFSATATGRGDATSSCPQWENSKEYRAYDYSHRFTGHSNAHTDIKEANFLGESAGVRGSRERRREHLCVGESDGEHSPSAAWRRLHSEMCPVASGGTHAGQQWHCQHN